MSYILSDRRDSLEFTAEHLRRYQEYLVSMRNRFPRSAYAIATSDWWYSFEDPRAPHDSALASLRMTDTWASTEDRPQFCSITVELEAANGGRIILTYPEVRKYNLTMPGEPSQIHGDWRYDEFTISDEDLLVHSIEWADGPVWTITATDLIHEYRNDDEAAEHSAGR